MLCKDIINIIEELYPEKTALEWDNVGLLVGRSDKEVEKIYVTLDVTEEAVSEAVAWEADMIISHHPLIFSPLKTITDEDFIGKRIITLLQNDISCYAMHTNYDVLSMGDLAAELLELEETEILEVTGYLEEVEMNVGIGAVGVLKEAVTLRECCENVKRAFRLQNVKVFGNLERALDRIAISPGSGKHMTTFALEKEADVLITGDIDHHEGLDAISQGLAVIDAGHYGLEHIFVEDIEEYLRCNLEGVQVRGAEIKHPFQVI